MLQFTDAYNGGQAYIVDYRDILSLCVIPTGDSAGFKVQVWLKATRVGHVAILESKAFPTVEEANEEAAAIAEQIQREKEGCESCAAKNKKRFIPYNDIKMIDIANMGDVSINLSNRIKKYCISDPDMMLYNVTKKGLIGSRFFGKKSIDEFMEYVNMIIHDGGMYF